MTRTSAVVLLVFTALGLVPADAPPAAEVKFIDHAAQDKRLTGYRTPEGFRLEVVAESPLVAQPRALTFADDGTPYVLEWLSGDGESVKEKVRYKDGTTREAMRLRKKRKDVVKALSATKAGGVWDGSRVVLDDDRPAGLLWHDGWLYLAGQGDVRRCRATKPGGSLDTRQVVAHGFGGAGVCGLTTGIDGWLYVTVTAGDHFVEGSDGSRATVLGTGAVFRCRPDGARVEVFAEGLSAPTGAGAFDLAGNLFHGAGDRLWHVADGTDCARLSGLPGASRVPAGLFLYTDTRLPEEYRGLLLAADPQRRLVRACRVEPAGASFRVAKTVELLTATDKRFRPCHITAGPDGAVYVVDARGTDGTDGRVYRLSWSGTKESPPLPPRGADSWARLIKQHDAALLGSLSADDGSDRDRARLELVRRGVKHRKALQRILENDEVRLTARVQALGALGSMVDADVQAALLRVLDDSDPELQRLAAEALGRFAPRADKAVHDGLLKALATEDAAVRRAVALAMGRVAGPAAGDNLASALSFDAGKDALLRDGLVRGLERLGKPGIDALIALADSGVQQDTDRVVEAFLTLRTRPAFDALPRVLAHRHVSAPQRAELVRSCRHYRLDPPVRLDAVVKFVTQGKQPAAVHAALAEVLAATGDGAKRAARLLLEKKLSPDTAADVAAALRRHAGSDAEAAKLLDRLKKR